MCTPAKVYVVLAILGIVGTLTAAAQSGPGVAVVTAMGTALFAWLWTMFLNWLCKRGQSGIAWALVFLPIVLTVGYLIFAFVEYMRLRRQYRKSK